LAAFDDVWHPWLGLPGRYYNREGAVALILLGNFKNYTAAALQKILTFDGVSGKAFYQKGRLAFCVYGSYLPSILARDKRYKDGGGERR
jgi:hypothetical protein